MTYGNYPDLGKVKKILVVKLRHHGDVLLTSPVFSLLKKTMPEASIDAYIYKDTLPMLDGHPSIENFICVERKKKGGFSLKRIFSDIKLLLSLRRNSYDLVINLTEGDRGAAAAYISGSRYRVGFERKGKNKIYTHVVKQCPTPRHTVEKQLDALRCIGIFPKKEERDLVFSVPQQSIDRCKELIPEGDYVVIHPVSRWRFKCLAPEAMAYIAEEIVSLNKKVVFTAGKDPIEKEMVDKIIGLCKSRQGIINLSGMTNLKELGAIIQRASLLLCVDTVALHMASALKTPVVALFGPTSEINWGPWMHPCSIVLFEKMPCRPCFKDGCAGSKMSDCLFSLSPLQVIAAAKQLLLQHKESYETVS